MSRGNKYREAIRIEKNQFFNNYQYNIPHYITLLFEYIITGKYLDWFRDQK